MLQRRPVISWEGCCLFRPRTAFPSCAELGDLRILTRVAVARTGLNGE